jgi:hypothetical protein
MRVKAIFICSQCAAEVAREYDVLDDKSFLADLLANNSIPAPLSETDRYIEKDVSKSAIGPADRVHRCGEKCLGVLEPKTVLTFNEE